jgi:hypothetical protein
MYVMVQPFVTGLRNPKKPVIAMVAANARDRHTRKFHQHCEDTIILFPLPSAINPLPFLSLFLSFSNKPYSNRRMGMAYLRAPPSLSQRARTRKPRSPRTSTNAISRSQFTEESRHEKQEPPEKSAKKKREKKKKKKEGGFKKTRFCEMGFFSLFLVLPAKARILLCLDSL